jgi:hypothetical protein
MTETTRIMEQVNRQCEQAHIVMGVAVDEELGDRISVTLLAARGGTRIADCGLRIAEWKCRRRARHRPRLEGGIDATGGSGISDRPLPRFVAPAPALSPEKPSNYHAAGRTRTQDGHE